MVATTTTLKPCRHHHPLPTPMAFLRLLRLWLWSVASILHNPVLAQARWDIRNKRWHPVNNGGTRGMMPDVQRMDLSRRMATVLWMLPLHHHYPLLPHWTAIVTLSLPPGPSHHWVTTIAALMSKGHHPDLTILHRITRLHLRSITDRRIEIRDAPFSLSKCPLICRRRPSTAGRPPQIFIHRKSTKTGKLRFRARLAELRSRQDINSGQAEKTKTKTPWNS